MTTGTSCQQDTASERHRFLAAYITSIAWSGRPLKRRCGARTEFLWTAALTEFLVHYQAERNHQGKGNVLLFATAEEPRAILGSTVRRLRRLGSLLNYYCRAA